MLIRSVTVSRAAAVSACVAMSCAALTALAQWTSDPNAPVLVQGDTGDQGIPLLGSAPDGRTWVFYVDSFAAGGGGYKHALQLLNADGTLAFGGAVVVSPARTNSATFNVDLDVSPAGDAVVAYDNSAIYVQKVDVTGQPQWGDANGLLIPNSAGAVGPQVVAMSDGGAVVCWGSSVNLNFQRVNADGSLGSGWVYTETGHALLPSDMIRSGSDFLILWTRGETTSFLSRKSLRIQKWDGAGVAGWNSGTPVSVYTSAASPAKSIQNGYFPRLIPDGANGAVVAWYDSGAARNAWLQHVNSDGTLRFTAGGAEGVSVSATAAATEYRISASVTYHADAGQYTVAYERSNPAQSLFGLAAQRFDSDGDRLWDPAGVAVQSANTNHASYINANDAHNDAIVTWLQYGGASGPQSVLSTRLDSAGTQIWTTSPLLVAADYGNKTRLQTTVSTSGDWLVASWGDGPAGTNDVMANRINFDGTLGDNGGGPTCPACAADYDQDGGVSGADIGAFFADFESGATCADVDQDGGITGADIGAFFVVFEAGGC